MRISKDPLAPARNWKELFFGERGNRRKKSANSRRRFANIGLSDVDAFAAH
jgi:hypothetical protein